MSLPIPCRAVNAPGPKSHARRDITAGLGPTPHVSHSTRGSSVLICRLTFVVHTATPGHTATGVIPLAHPATLYKPTGVPLSFSSAPLLLLPRPYLFVL